MSRGQGCRGGAAPLCSSGRHCLLQLLQGFPSLRLKQLISLHGVSNNMGFSGAWCYFPRKDSRGRKRLLYVSSELVPGTSKPGKHSLYARATRGGRYRCQSPAWDPGCPPSPWLRVRGSRTTLARIPEPGARRICHVPAASFWAVFITSWSLLWEADWRGSWKVHNIHQRLSGVLSAVKTEGVIRGNV